MLFILTAVSHHNVQFRALLYWSYFYSAVGAGVLIACTIIIIGMRDVGHDTFEEVCKDYPEMIPDSYQIEEECGQTINLVITGNVVFIYRLK